MDKDEPSRAPDVPRLRAEGHPPRLRYSAHVDRRGALRAVARAVLVFVWRFFWWQARAGQAVKQSPYPLVAAPSEKLPPEPRLEQLNRNGTGRSSQPMFNAAGGPGKGPEQLRADRRKGLCAHPHPAGHQDSRPAICRSQAARGGPGRQRPADRCGGIQLRPHVSRSTAMEGIMGILWLSHSSLRERARVRAGAASALLLPALGVAAPVRTREPSPDGAAESRLRPATERTGAAGSVLHR